jgi:L-alanine-DL-glutamate epimerase-like enolase superfamily enzyme
MTGPTGPDPGSRIVAADVHVLRAPVTDRIAMSFSALEHRAMVLLELETARGIRGRGESWVNFPAWATEERIATLREGVLPLVVGADARYITALHRKLVDHLEPIARQWGAIGPVMQAISAVDIALWDAAAQLAGRSISHLVGGPVRHEIAVYASSLGPNNVSEQALRCRDAGFSAVKVKLGFGAATDTEILSTARKVCGDQMVLYADANQGWTLAEAVRFAPVLIEHDVSWVEEPVRGDQLADLERFHEATGIAVATGENVYRSEGFWEYIASPAVQVVQPDVAKTGGLSEAFAICQLADAKRKSVIPHLYGGAVAFAATLQLAACCPAVRAVEYDVRDNPLRDPLIVDPPVPVDGVIAIPQAPGLGLELDHAALEAMSQKHQRVELTSSTALKGGDSLGRPRVSCFTDDRPVREDSR